LNIVVLLLFWAFVEWTGLNTLFNAKAEPDTQQLKHLFVT